MSTNDLSIPRSLLQDPALRPTAKLLWLVAHLQPTGSTAALARRAGLSEGTVQQGLVELRQRGWLSKETSRTPHPTVTMPVDLVLDQRVGAQGKLLYGTLQLVPGLQGTTGQVKTTSLQDLAGVSLPTVRRALLDLAGAGWVRLNQVHRLAPIRFSLHNPYTDPVLGELELLQLEIDEAEYKGQAVMRGFLSVLVDSRDYEDDARPEFLRNPMTDEILQFDRYYHCGVAWEFNGPQHYRTTRRFPKAKELKAQRTRDYIKAGICLERNIRLVVVHAWDLNRKVMLENIGGWLPLRDLRHKEPLLDYLDKAGQEVLREAKRQGWGPKN